MRSSRTLRWIFLSLSLLIAIPLCYPTRVWQLPMSPRAKFAIRAHVLEFATCEYAIDCTAGAPPGLFLWRAQPDTHPGIILAGPGSSKVWPTVDRRSVELHDGLPGAPSKHFTLRVISIPLLPPALILFAATLILWLRWWRRRAVKPGTCSRCGYDLTGNASGVCPECGNSVLTAPPAVAQDSSGGTISA